MTERTSLGRATKCCNPGGLFPPGKQTHKKPFSDMQGNGNISKSTRCEWFLLNRSGYQQAIQSAQFNTMQQPLFYWNQLSLTQVAQDFPDFSHYNSWSSSLSSFYCLPQNQGNHQNLVKQQEHFVLSENVLLQIFSSDIIFLFWKRPRFYSFISQSIGK